MNKDTEKMNTDDDRLIMSSCPFCKKPCGVMIQNDTENFIKGCEHYDGIEEVDGKTMMKFLPGGKKRREKLLKEGEDE